MFCKNCGTQLPDNANFCNSCGASLSSQPTKISTSKKIKVNPLVIVGIIAVALMAFWVFPSNRNYEATVDDFLEGLFEADEKLLISTFSESYKESQMEYNGYTKESQLVNYYREYLDDMAEEYRDGLGKNWKYSYRIVDITEDQGEVELIIEITLSGKKMEDSALWGILLVKDGKNWYVDEFYDY